MIGFTVFAIVFIQLFLLVRFVQPEIVYWFRDELTSVRSNRLAVVTRAIGRGDLERTSARQKWIDRESFLVLVQDLQPERSWYSTKGMFRRCIRIRELHEMLRVGLEEHNTKFIRRRASLCIVETANMVSAAAREIVPKIDYEPGTLEARDILNLVIEKRDGSVVPKTELAALLVENPLSIEEIIEIQISSLQALLYRAKR